MKKILLMAAVVAALAVPASASASHYRFNRVHMNPIHNYHVSPDPIHNY
jgi:hypothetical protein